ncbi:helix-turn-helix transcriptional regulator [Brevundimonas sp. CEF1]|uniref:helix-turn-helix transcriptional regulator n=1 Tax=Brevundimonas sp. CEF1 TaxID=3442642 RepID=UPI003F51252B
MSDPIEKPLIEVGGRDDRLLSWSRVHDLTGLSRSTAWRLQRAGTFPKSVALSPGRVGWWESELTAWKKTRSSRSLRTPVAVRPCGMPRKQKPKGLSGTLQPPASTMQEPLATERVQRRRRLLQVHPGQIDFDF